MGYILIGILFTGLFAGLLPPSTLSNTMRHDDWKSPALMALIGLPAYSGVLPGMMRIGLIFEHGNSTGAAFILFELGVGFNLGLISWVMSELGWRRGMLWLLMICVLVIGVGYVMEQTLYFAKEEAVHTHAFDDWTSPFPYGSNVSYEVVLGKLMQKVEVLEPVALGGLLFLFILGTSLSCFDRAGQVEKWLTTHPPVSEAPVGVLNRGVPGPVLGVVALLGLVVFSLVALYIYYPDTKQAFSEIIRVRTDVSVAVRTGKKDEAIRRIQQWDLLTRKLQVGVFIRTGSMDPEVGKITEDLRERLEDLRDALLADDLAKAKELLPIVEKAYGKFRACFKFDE
jgi:hypothetical protein